ncbi:helix-turn-helix domain-containing protein [Cohnella sp. GCM10027633]|uniref:helix-turn-helix domain-containing protein n=1 Tax=unclassified Cohnella TaxID=2636738 RepID=UPI0036330E3E
MRLHVRYEHDIPINAFRWTPKPYKEPLHYHTSLEIGCCVSGRGTFHFGNKSFAVRPGDGFVVNNAELHIAQSDPDEPCTFIFLNFDPEWLQKEDEQLLLPFCYPSDRFLNHIPAESPLAVELSAIAARIETELQDRSPGYRSAAKGSLLQLCALLLREHASRLTDEDRARQGAAFREVRELLSYVESHYTEPLVLGDLARRMGVSPSRASRRFLEATGRAFKDYVLQLRLNEARRQLLGTSVPVTDVIFASGFQSVPSFYRSFAAAEGMSPADYRKQYGSIAINENPE